MGDLKVGDKIAINTEFGRGVELHVIERVTPTMYIAKHARFRRDNLRLVGYTGWGPSRGRIPTDADILSSRISLAKIRLIGLVVTPDNIDAIERLLKEQTP